VKILTISDMYPPLFLGGYELLCRDVMEELDRRGHDVCVLTSRWKRERAPAEGDVQRLLHFHPLILGPDGPPPASGILRWRKRYGQVLWACRTRRNRAITHRVLAARKPDLAYAWNMQKIGIGPLLALQESGIPIVLDIDDYWLSDLKSNLDLERNPLKRLFHSAITGLQRVDQLDLRHMVFCSHSFMQHHVSMGFLPENMVVIANGIPARMLVDAGDLAAHSPAQESYRFLFVGRLVPEKGPDIAIQALAKLVQDMHINASLDLIGSGPGEYVERLRGLAASLMVAERVHFLGMMDRQAVLERYSQYTALWFTSRWQEPFGLTILEAMARGLPVVAAERGAALTLIADGETGLLVPPDDAERLAAAAARLAQDPTLGHKMRLAALKRCREQYTLERMADRVEQYLQGVLRETTCASC